MIIGVATENNMVCQHFGQTPGFSIFEVDGDEIKRREIGSPGHEPGKLPAFLKAEGVTHVIAGGMGPKAVELFCASGIEVILGISGNVDDAVKDLVAGNLKSGESTCHHPM